MRYQQNMRCFGENIAKTSLLTGQLTGVIVLGLKKEFIKHFCAWVNPINVCFNLYSKNSVHHLKHFQNSVYQRMRTRDGSRVGFFGSGSGLTFIREIGLNRGHTS